MDDRTIEEVRNNETKLINEIKALEQQRQKAIDLIHDILKNPSKYEGKDNVGNLLKILGGDK